VTDSLTIAQAAARSGLPESTLRYWERIGLVDPVLRDESSRHRRYTAAEVSVLETLGNLRAVGLSIEDMRAYLGRSRDDAAAAAEQAVLFQRHADRLADEIARLELRRTYLELKVKYWTARAAGDSAAAEAVAAELGPLIRRINPQESDA
jgi:DNA-binding transcriptional MerR regulator